MMHEAQVVALAEMAFGAIALVLNAIVPRLDLHRGGIVLAITGVVLFVLLQPLNPGIP